MGTFPIYTTPGVPWHNLKSARNSYFGAGRVGYPVHGACDLIVPAGTEVLAVEDGEIIRGPYEFLHLDFDYKDPKTQETKHCESQTYAIDVKHSSFIARYCEIALRQPHGLSPKNIKEGQVIAYVGTQCGGTMLHFEMFRDVNNPDTLTDKSTSTKYLYVPQKNYMRRKDLLDPTPYLDAWAWDVLKREHRTMDLSLFQNP